MPNETLENFTLKVNEKMNFLERFDFLAWFK